MVKYDLHEKGFSVEERAAKQSRVTIIWAVSTVVMVVGTLFAVYLIGRVGDKIFAPSLLSPDAIPLALQYLTEIVEQYGVIGYIGLLIVLLFLYLALKLIVTILFCRNRQHSIKLTVLADKAMPVCFCREAFKVWQTVLIYLIPAVLLYSMLFALCAFTLGEGGYILVILFLIFIISFDVTLVIYLPYIKIKYGADYISIDHHIYVYTLFNKPYIKVNKKVKKLPRLKPEKVN